LYIPLPWTTRAKLAQLRPPLKLVEMMVRTVRKALTAHGTMRRYQSTHNRKDIGAVWPTLWAVNLFIVTPLPPSENETQLLLGHET
jgi:hypothetical protein